MLVKDLRSGHPRIVVQNRQKSGISVGNSKTEVRKQINSHVKIEDIKSKYLSRKLILII